MFGVISKLLDHFKDTPSTKLLKILTVHYRCKRRQKPMTKKKTQLLSH